MKVLAIDVEFCRGHINEIRDMETLETDGVPFGRWAKQYARDQGCSLENGPSGCCIAVDRRSDDYGFYIIPETHPAWRFMQETAQPLDEDAMVNLQKLVEF
jgi:hypothetical protein